MNNNLIISKITMKKIFYFLSLLLMSTIYLSSCKEEIDVHDTKIVAFDLAPTEPDRNVVITRTDTTYTSTDAIALRWNRTSAENGTPVYYSVVFAGENGSFENPAYSIASNSLGWRDTLKVSSELLNIVAERCGIPANQSGIIKWKVKAGNGVVSVLSNNESKFQVTRPLGFAEYPTSLYMLGSATEAGDSLTSAIKGSYVRKGTFEFITTLKSGNYFFTDKKTPSKNYQVTNGVISYGNSSVSPASAKQLYRIRMVFYKGQSNIFEIQKMEMIMPNIASGATTAPTKGLSIAQLDYAGNGVWKKLNFPALKPDGTDITNGIQYKFRMTGVFAGDTTPTEYYYGYFTDSDPIANAKVPDNTSPESYFYCKETNNLDKNYYRFGNAKGKKLNVTIYLTPGLKNYYHNCTIIEE